MPDEAPDYLAEALLYLALIFAPFAFATTEAWSRAVLCAIVFALLLHRLRLTGAAALVNSGLSPAFWSSGTLILVAGLQMTRPAVPEALALAHGPFTLSRSLTLAFALDWLCYAVLLLAVPPIFRNPKAIARFAWLILIIGATLAVAGLAQRMAGDTHYFGIRPISPLNVPFGPFPNKNHAGTLLAMSVCAGGGLLADLIARSRILRRQGMTDELLGQTLVLLCLLSVALGGLVASRARAALLALAVTGVLASLTRLLDRSTSIRSRAILATVVAVAIVGGISAHRSGASLLGYVTSGSVNSYGFRLAMARDAFRLIQDFPLFGIGFGAYRVASPLYHDKLLDYFFVDYVHCDPIQMAAEGGIPLALVFYGLTLLTIGVSLRRSGREGFPNRHAAQGLLFACIVVMLHQLVDFPSRIPGVQAIFIATLAVVWGRSLPTTPAPSQANSPTPLRLGLFAIFLSAFWLLAFVPKVAATYFDLMSSRTIPPSTHYYQTAALSWEPTFERQWAMAWEYARAAEENPMARAVLWRRALRHSRAALDLEPFHPNLRRFHASLLRALARRDDAGEFEAAP